MTLSIGMITIDSSDPVALGRWWSEQVGGTILAENEGFFVMVATAEGSPVLGFQKVDDPTPGKNRIHLDLTSAEPAAEIDRMVANGATKIDEHEMPGFSWTTLADPDGNLFCVSHSH